MINKYMVGNTSTVQGLGVNGALSNDSFFNCPSIENGGLAKTNTMSPDAGQASDVANVEDIQATRMPYTLNEAVCGRNKFNKGFQTASSTFRYVRAGQVNDSGGTILATEFVYDWRIVADASRTDASKLACKSHRPVHGFSLVRGSAGNANLNMELLPDTSASTYQKVTTAELCSNTPVNYTTASTKTRLDWVGRNHGTGSYDKKKSNFLYVDGHVETKNIVDTLGSKFEWGEKMYSLRTGANLTP